jgi:alpha-ketoglutarate-dependent taurine dioxygenase
MRIGNNSIMLNHDTQLFPHHIDEQKLFDFSEVIGVVTQHPTNPNIWGLKNVSGQKWVTTTADGTVKDVENGRSVTITVGTRVNFGKVEGEIRV